MAGLIKQMRPILGFVMVLALVGGVTGDPRRRGRGFVRAHGTQFVLHGSPFFFNGFNSYWLMNVAVEPSERYKVSSVFSQAAAAGLTVCRTWAFGDGGDRALQISPGVYDERVFQALDFVVAEARRHGIRLILSLVNNFNDYGGRAQYVQWARNAGVPATNDDDFYTNPTIKSYYKNHVKRVLTRFNAITKTMYKDDPTVMAWELMNEPRCQTDYSGNTVHEWVGEVAAFTKSLDGKHLLEIGMEGFYGDSLPEKKQNNPGYQVGTDFIKSNLLREIDFATIHAYPDIWLSGQSEGSQLSFVEKWMWNHWQDAKTILKKPLVFAEFGKSKKDPGYTINERDELLTTVYRDISTIARQGGGMAGGLIWQLMAEGMDPYYDGYEIVLPLSPSSSSIISRQSHVMSSLNHVLGGARGHALVGEVHGHHHKWRRPHMRMHGHPHHGRHGHHRSGGDHGGGHATP